MSNFFSADNPFQVFMTLVFDLILLNVLWIIFCIPIITAGASTIALYTVMLRRVKNEEGYILKGFFEAFKANFKESLPVTLLFWGLTIVLVLDYMIVSRMEGQMMSLLQGVFLFLGVVLIAVFSYVWPLMAKFENTRMNTLNNACRLAIAKLPKTLIMVLLNGLPVFLFLLAPQAFIIVIWIYPFIGFSLTAYVNSRILNSIFDSLMT